MMLGLFANCHEFVMFFSIPQKAFIASEYFWEEFNNTPQTSYIKIKLIKKQLQRKHQIEQR
jgi:hypothetical protein